jgi:pimeloyl-ACP methyl ester carboxylesterase
MRLTYGSRVAYDIIGPLYGTPVVLMNGAGSDMSTIARDEFITPLVDAGCRALIFDLKYCGMSFCEEEEAVSAPTPGNALHSVANLVQHLTIGASITENANYTLEILAQEVLAFLDAVDFDAAGPIARAESNSKAPVFLGECEPHGKGLQRAHFFGHSMGGMVAQIIASREPERVLSLTTFASCVGPAIGPAVHQSMTQVIPLLAFDRLTETDNESISGAIMAMMKKLNAYRPVPESFLRTQAARKVTRMTRGFRVHEVTRWRCIGAVLNAPSRAKAMQKLAGTVSVLALHGESDPLIPYKNAEALAQACGGRFVTFPGGHVMVPEVCERLVAELLAHVRESESRASGKPAPKIP